MAADRWNRLTGFVRKWYVDPLGPDDGVPEADLLAAEARLGARLPQALREWYRLVGARVRAASQDRPVALEDLRIQDGALPVLVEKDGGWTCAIRVEDLGKSDPPVHADRRAFDEEPFVCQRLSEFFLVFVLLETTLHEAMRELGATGPNLLGETRSGIRARWLPGHFSERVYLKRYAQLPIPDYVWGEGTVAYGDADSLLTKDFGMARTDEAWKRLKALGNWLP